MDKFRSMKKLEITKSGVQGLQIRNIDQKWLVGMLLIIILSDVI